MIHTVPLPPSKNRSHFVTKTGVRVLMPAVRAFREAIAKQFAGFDTISGPAVLTATFHPSRRGRFDQHNRLPQLCDALEAAGVIADDQLFVSTHSHLGEVRRPAGACEFEIEVLP